MHVNEIYVRCLLLEWELNGMKEATPEGEEGCFWEGF
jgi:hypothetical protein